MESNILATNSRFFSLHLLVFAVASVLSFSAAAQEPLLIPVGAPSTLNVPDHVVAKQAVRVNPRALNSPRLSIELFDETVVAIRTSEERRQGTHVWVGHLEGQAFDSVIITTRGRHYSAMIQRSSQMYRLGSDQAGQNQLMELMLDMLPPDDAADLPDGGASESLADTGPEAVAENTVQDLLVAYTAGACSAAGGCAQLEADIVTAVADINAAYAASGILITMNLVGTAQTDYELTVAGDALSHLRGTTDGYMDELHPLRDQLGADIVSLIYNGSGCGIGYLSSSASSAFNVTRESCMVGNRTLAHEIGHNQGAHHDRVTVGTTSTTTYNYGYRRCNNTALADYAPAPHFRTIMSYSCTNATRVGILSSPDHSYSGVPQGIDADIDPALGADNARRLNERAATVAAFRQSAVTEPPAAPSGLIGTAVGPDSIQLNWVDNSNDETTFVLQVSADGSTGWSNIASLGANTVSYEHNGLNPEETYFYRVRAENSAGSSGYSNTASVTTDALPDFVEDRALADLFGRGSMSGGYQSTWYPNDGVVQTLTEQSSGGPRRSRKQSYDHAWSFDVFGGAGGVIVTVHAWVSGDEGAMFWYSVDGGATRNPMFTANNTAPDGGRTFSLPGGVSGGVQIGVNDATQSNGESVDSVTIDQILITSYTSVGDPPGAPTSLSVIEAGSTSVSLNFQDGSDNEWGFEVWRSGSALGSCFDGDSVGSLGAADGSVDFIDDSAQPETSYHYWVSAFNGAGDSACSNSVVATTGAAPSLSLDSADGYKVKGQQKVDLTWTAAVDVRVLRDGAEVHTAAASESSWTDPINRKGGGTYVYQICNVAGTCSNTLTVTF